MEKDRKTIIKRTEIITCIKGEKTTMSYTKDNVKKCSFDLPSIIKDQVEEYCSINDRNQSQVFREAITKYIFSVKHQNMDRQQVG